MRKLRIVIASLVLTLVAAGTVVAAGETFFRAKLAGSFEVPVNTSKATGHAQFWLNSDGTQLRYRLLVSRIENVTQAHIHVGPLGINGPVVLFLYPSAPPPVLIPGPFSGILNEGTATAANLIGPLAGQPLSALVAALESGGAYVNVHTSQLPGGEIRGQVE
jgi:hypothetical protein